MQPALTEIETQPLRVSPLAVRSAIESMLNEPPGALRIDLDRDKVILSGVVSSSAERRTIETAARDVQGVRTVESHLQVRREAAQFT
jgi:osmotically-inducible protein OsmY